MPRRNASTSAAIELTLKRDMLLLLGPNPGRPCPEPESEEWEVLRACWEQHRYDEDGRRARELLVKSRGMPSRLSPRERREAEAILEKLDYPGFGGRAAGILLPFRPVGAGGRVRPQADRTVERTSG